MALLAIMALAGLSLAMVQIGASFSKETVSRIDDERAVYLAEGGLAESVFALRAGGTGVVASQAVPARLGQGIVWCTATPIDNNRTVVVASAAVGKGRASIEATIAPVAHPAQRYGLFSEEDMIIEPSSIIDSFDSSLGSYEDQLASLGGTHVNDDALLGSNHNIHVEKPSEIWGDVEPGPASLATSDDPDAISGSTSSAETTLSFDPVTTPSIPSQGPLLVVGGQTRVVPPGDHHYSVMDTGVDAHTIVQGPARIIADDWLLRSNAEFTFDASGGPIELYLTGDVKLASNSEIITTSLMATGVSVYLVGGPDQSVEFDSNSTFYGTIYGPEAEVEIASNFEVFGSIAARHIILNANSNIHYDEALLTGSAGQLIGYEIQTWREVEFPIPAMKTNRRDPFDIMGLDKNALQSPGALNGL